MIEMAPNHVLFIPDILYVINDDNPINNHKVLNRLQDHITEYILRLSSYKSLPNTFTPTDLQYETFCKPLPMIILSEDNPLFLNTALSSYIEKISNISSLTVVYTASNEAFNDAYKKLIATYPEVRFLSSHGQTNVVLDDLLQMNPREENPYIVLGTDLILLTHEIDLFDCLKEMQRTQTKSFLLSNQNPPSHAIELNDSFSALTIEKSLKYTHLCSDAFLGIFDKKQLSLALKTNQFLSSGLLQALFQKILNKDEVTLFYKDPIAQTQAPEKLTISYNKEALLKRFNKE